MRGTAQSILVTYTNYRGKISSRQITPRTMFWGSTEYHPEPQWLMKAYDHGKRAMRTFALRDMCFREPEPTGVPEFTDYVKSSTGVVHKATVTPDLTAAWCNNIPLMGEVVTSLKGHRLCQRCFKRKF